MKTLLNNKELWENTEIHSQNVRIVFLQDVKY